MTGGGLQGCNRGNGYTPAVATPTAPLWDAVQVDIYTGTVSGSLLAESGGIGIPRGRRVRQGVVGVPGSRSSVNWQQTESVGIGPKRR